MRDALLANPVGVMAEEVFSDLGLDLTISQVSDANRVLPAAFANEEFMEWAAAYQEGSWLHSTNMVAWSIGRRSARSWFALSFSSEMTTSCLALWT
jgi:hypothetical protein